MLSAQCYHLGSRLTYPNHKRRSSRFVVSSFNRKEKMSIQEYIEEHGLGKKVEDVINAAVKAKAPQPIAFMVRNHGVVEGEETDLRTLEIPSTPSAPNPAPSAHIPSALVKSLLWYSCFPTIRLCPRTQLLFSGFITDPKSLGSLCFGNLRLSLNKS